MTEHQAADPSDGHAPDRLRRCPGQLLPIALRCSHVHGDRRSGWHRRRAVHRLDDALHRAGRTRGARLTGQVRIPVRDGPRPTTARPGLAGTHGLARRPAGRRGQPVSGSGVGDRRGHRHCPGRGAGARRAPRRRTRPVRNLGRPALRGLPPARCLARPACRLRPGLRHRRGAGSSGMRRGARSARRCWSGRPAGRRPRGPTGQRTGRAR